MNLEQSRAYFNKKPVTFVIRENYKLIEDQQFVPKFSIKGIKELADMPVNEPIKYSDAVMIKAIKYGMILLFNYKGEKDGHFSGHERVVYPMVLGRSSKGKTLLRAWHLNGFSVSSKRHITKIWRLFRTDRILSITFTGTFYRLPPAGYNMNDKGMRGGIIAKADFNVIRKNQQNLVTANKIQNTEEISLGTDERKFITIKVKTTETKLDLMKPLENAYINNAKDIANIRVSFLKSIYGNKYCAVLGALGEPGNTVKILSDKGTNLGVFKVLDSIAGDTLKKIKTVKGNTIYDLYLFDKKV